MQRNPSISSTSSQKSSLLQRGLTRAGSILRRQPKDEAEGPAREMVHCAAPSGHVHLVGKTCLDRDQSPEILAWLGTVQASLPGEALLGTGEVAKTIPESVAMCGAKVQIQPDAHLLLRVIKVALTGPLAEQPCQLVVRLNTGDGHVLGRNGCTILPKLSSNSEECFLIGIPASVDVKRAAVEISVEPVRQQSEEKKGGIKGAIGGLLQRRNSTLNPEVGLSRRDSQRHSPLRSKSADVIAISIPLRMLCQGRALPARLALHPADRDLLLNPPAEMGGRYLLYRGDSSLAPRLSVGEICVHLQATPGSLSIRDEEAEQARQASLKPRHQQSLTVWHQGRWQRHWVILTPDCRLLLLDECRPQRGWQDGDFLPLEHVVGIECGEEPEGDDLALIPGISHGLKLMQKPADKGAILAYADDAAGLKQWTGALSQALHGRAKLTVK